jgi:alkylated DNA repair dioxygenase AlkB
VLQLNLLASGPPGVDTSVSFERVELDEAAWVDVARGFVHGADDLLDEVVESTAWRSGRRWMYDRVVDDPRLSWWWRHGQHDPAPLLGDVRAAIERHYGVELGGVVLNYYRHGDDSVAFHRDRELRDPERTLVAILTMGAQRPFRLRPFGGGASIDLAPASGDLLVMGGRCQAAWEHSVPKVHRPVGPRVSASWRWSGDASHRRAHRDGYFTSRDWRVVAPPG